MKTRIWLNRLMVCFSIGILITALFPARPAQAAGFAVVGTGFPASCTEAALDAALALAPINILFNCGPAPITILISTQKNITADVTMDGAELITLSGTLGGPATRLFNVAPAVTLDVSNLIITDFNAGVGDGGAIFNAGNLHLDNVEITSNQGHDGGAVFNLGNFRAYRSTLDNNIASRFAGAIFNETPGVVRLINITLSGNNGPYGGGGLYNSGGSASLVNVTVYNNSADGGGSGVYNTPSGGSVTLLNSIIAKNRLASNCTGTITSNGYNLSSDTTCVSQPTDLASTDPLLLILGNYGGYTPTNRPKVSPLSPAIDAGTVTGCPSEDQRGKPRPFGTTCDIGAVEIQGPNSPDGGAAGPWFVAPTGLDSNPCNLTTAPCQTINGVIAKAQPNDVIYVAQGTYTEATGSEVVTVNKDLIIEGGWDSSFTSQIGMSTIDGQHSRRGITVSGNHFLNINHFIVQHGSATYGGGAYVEGSLYGSYMVFQYNTAFAGGGIYVNKGNGVWGSLLLTESGIYYNTFTGYAGGVDVEDGGASLSNVTLSHNEFLPAYPEEPAQGGSMFVNKGVFLLTFVTSAFNIASSGIYVNSTGKIYADYSIFGDSAGCAGTTANIFSDGSNLDIGNSCNLVAAHDLVNTNPELGPLQYNGGDSQTHALAFYSPAIDAAYPYQDPCSVFTDQRNVSRPKYTRCDIGAYEYNGFNISLVSHLKALFPLGLNKPKGLLTVDTGDNSISMGGLDYRQRDLMPDRPMPATTPLKSFDLFGFCDVSVCPAPMNRPAAAPSATDAMTSTYQLSSPITLTLTYTDSELSAAGITLASLHLLVLNPATNQWHEIPVTVDEVQHIVIAHTTYLGTFYLVGGWRRFIPQIMR